MAANQQCAAAQFNLAVCFKNGLGVAKDEKSADELYRSVKRFPHIIREGTWAFCEALRVAVRFGRLESVKYFLKIDLVVYNLMDLAGRRDIEILEIAVNNDDLPIVKHLLQIPEIRVNAAAKNNRCLRIAVDHGDLPIVNCLLEIPTVLADVAISVPDFPPSLMSAISGGYGAYSFQVAGYWGYRSDEMTTQRNVPLSIAIQRGHLSVVFRLLQAYQTSRTPFPDDLKIEDQDLPTFFGSYSARLKLAQEALAQRLPLPPVREIVEDYLGIIFKVSITPAFQASKVMTNAQNINSSSAADVVLKHTPALSPVA